MADSRRFAQNLIIRKVGVLLADGFDLKVKDALVPAIKKAEATPAIVAPKVGGVENSSGKKHAADVALSGSPSVLFDAVAILAGPAGDKSLSLNPDAISFLMDACRHLRAIGLSGSANLADKAKVLGIVGVIDLETTKGTDDFIALASGGKVWDTDGDEGPGQQKPKFRSDSKRK